MDWGREQLALLPFEQPIQRAHKLAVGTGRNRPVADEDQARNGSLPQRLEG